MAKTFEEAVAEALTDSYIVPTGEPGRCKTVRGQALSFLQTTLRARGWKGLGGRWTVNGFRDFTDILKDHGFIVTRDGVNQRKGTPCTVVYAPAQAEKECDLERARR